MEPNTYDDTGDAEDEDESLLRRSFSCNSIENLLSILDLSFIMISNLMNRIKDV